MSVKRATAKHNLEGVKQIAARPETKEGKQQHHGKAERKHNTYQEANATAELGWVAVANCWDKRGQ